MKIKIDEFLIKSCDASCLPQILQIEQDVLKELEDLNEPDLLRKNTEEMLLECLSPPHITIGAWYDGVLAAFSILYVPTAEPENLSLSLENVNVDGLKTANYKLCIVRKEFRGNSLQYELGVRLEKYAVEAGIGLICLTASPKNKYSVHNVERLGYRYNRTLMKYGFERDLFYKFL